MPSSSSCCTLGVSWYKFKNDLIYSIYIYIRLHIYNMHWFYCAIMCHPNSHTALLYTTGVDMSRCWGPSLQWGVEGCVVTARARLETGYGLGDEQYDRTITSKVTAPPPATALFIIMFTNTAAATKTLKKVQFSGLAAWLIWKLQNYLSISAEVVYGGLAV